MPHPRQLLEDTPVDVLERLERARRITWHLLLLTAMAATTHAAWVTFLALDPASTGQRAAWAVPLALAGLAPAELVADQALLEEAWSTAGFVPAAVFAMFVLRTTGIHLRGALAAADQGPMPAATRHSRRSARRRAAWIAAGAIATYGLLLRIDLGGPAWPANALATWVTVATAAFLRDHWSRLAGYLQSVPEKTTPSIEHPDLHLVPQNEVA